MGSWNKIESGITPVDNKIEFDTESLGKFALKVTEGRLPSEYQEVEYIESTGTQYVYIPISYIDGIELDYQLTSVEEPEIFGYSNSSFTQRFEMTIWHDQWDYAITGDNYLGAVDLARHFIKAGNFISGKVYFDNILKTTISVTALNYGFPLFGRNRWGTYGAAPGIGKIYSCKLYTTATLVTDLVPCYCTKTVTAYQGATQTTAASGTAGMYDLVENKFYINSGTGSFTVGPDVN